ncbi:MAG: hypothetical protein OHK0013_43500 [Sandaracinaceae bacterium]
MKRFEIHCAWSEGVPSLTDPALARSFAELTIAVDGVPLTRHQSTSGTHDALFVPVLPIALWALRRWTAIFSEAAPAFLSTRRRSLHDALAEAWEHVEAESEPEIQREWEASLETWERSHALRFVGEGLLLPDLLLRRVGPDVQLSWRAWEPREDFRFLSTGNAQVPVEAVVEALRSVVSSVRARIASVDRSVSSASWFDELAPRAQASWSEEAWPLLADRLGMSFDDFQTWARGQGARLKETIVRDFVVPPALAHDPVVLDSPVAMAFRSASEGLTEAARVTLKQHAMEMSHQAPAHALAALRGRLQPEPRDWLPWSYRQAGEVRRLLNASGRLDIEAVLAGLGVPVHDVDLDDPRTDGVALWTDERARVLVNGQSPRAATQWGRRALLAHELFHLLFDVRARGVFGEATGDALRMPSEPLAGAFAAELLAPQRELPRFDSRFWTQPSIANHAVKDVCDRFGVGRELALRQLQNRREWPEPLVETLLAMPAA